MRILRRVLSVLIIVLAATSLFANGAQEGTGASAEKNCQDRMACTINRTCRGKWSAGYLGQRK